MSTPDVLIIMPHRSGQELLAASLTSLQHIHYPREHWQVMLIDNASSDGSCEWAQQQFPSISIHRLSNNMGFAYPCNIGLRRAISESFDYAVLLNDDTRVEPDWLAALVDVPEQNSQVGIVGSKIKTWDGNLIEFAGSIFHLPTTAGGYLDQPDQGQCDSIYSVGYACGASALYRITSLREIGLLDEDYFAYHEDVDLSIRAWVAGWTVMYTPHSTMYHMRSASTPRVRFDFRSYMGYRNALTTVLKCYQVRTVRQFARCLLTLYVKTGPNWRRRAFIINILRFPNTMKKRLRVQEQRKRIDTEWFGQIPHQVT